MAADETYRPYTNTRSRQLFRYARIGAFLAELLLYVLWTARLGKLPWLRSAGAERSQELAYRYRMLAHREGGLLIKAGQFLSLRVDLFSQAVCTELALLQDRVPAAPWPLISQQIEADLNRPIAQLFAWISPEAIASASIAQVHAAQLHTGGRVVVKVVRPGVIDQFAVDLKIVALFVRALNWLPQVRRSFDLPQLLAEFVKVTNRELELREEGKNAERFARDFADDATLYMPTVYWPYSGAYTLTLEDVGYLSLHNLAAIEAAGIDRTQIAQQLAESIVKQIFVFHFVHADPHPGNIFIKPLPHPVEQRADFVPGEAVPYTPNRPFQIALIDFGMAIAIPPEAQVWLREFIIGLGLGDAHRIIYAYELGGLLRPDVDLARVVAMTEDLLSNFPEMLVGIFPDLAAEETQRFFAKHGDLLGSNYPFKIPVDLLFMYRALSTMALVVKQLDPTFEVSTVVTPLALQLLWQTWQKEWQTWSQSLLTLGQLLLATPPQPERLLRQAQVVLKAPTPFTPRFIPPVPERSVQTYLAAQDRQLLQPLIKAVERLTWAVLVIGCLLAFILWRMEFQGVSLLTPLAQHAGGWGLLFLLTPLLFLLRWWLLR